MKITAISLMTRAGLLAIVLILQIQAQDVTLSVDAGRKAGFKIPRTIYGTFLEPIGNSIYGGLWAQLLENPSFEDNLWSAGHLRSKLEANPALVRDRNWVCQLHGNRSISDKAPDMSRAGVTQPTRIARCC